MMTPLRGFLKNNQNVLRKAAVAEVGRMTGGMPVFRSTDTLVFLDDSGEIALPSRKKHKPHLGRRFPSFHLEFVLGGVAIRGSDYDQICQKWNEFKVRHLGSASEASFHSADDLMKLDSAGRCELESFLTSANFYVIVGWHPLNLDYDPERNMSATISNTLSVIEIHLDQIFTRYDRCEHWIFEKSDKIDFRIVLLNMSGEWWNRFPKRSTSTITFVEKKINVLPGLDLADLISNLYHNLNENSGRSISRKYCDESPSFRLRLWQAAIAMPFPPLCWPDRRPQSGLSKVEDLF